MNRYQIAIAKTEPGRKPITFHRLPRTMNIGVVKRAIIACSEKRIILDGVNIDRSVLDRAVILTSKDTGIPVFVTTRGEATGLSVAYSYHLIRCGDKLPSDDVAARISGKAILYGRDVKPPIGLEVFVVIT